ALAQGGERDLVAFAGRRGLRGGCRSSGLGGRGGGFSFGGRGLGSGRRFGRRFLGGRSGSLGGAGTRAVADADQRCSDFSGLVFGDEDFLDHAGDRRGDLGVYFVGGNFEQGLVHLYPVT